MYQEKPTSVLKLISPNITTQCRGRFRGLWTPQSKDKRGAMLVPKFSNTSQTRTRPIYIPDGGDCTPYVCEEIFDIEIDHEILISNTTDQNLGTNQVMGDSLSNPCISHCSYNSI
jgi:hypothetical protein